MPQPAAPTETKPADPAADLLARYDMADDPDSHPPQATDPVDPAEPAVAAEAPPAEPAAPAAPQHPAALVRRARLLGFDPDEVAGMSTGDLQDAVFEAAITRAADARADSAARARDPDTGRFLPADGQPQQPADGPFDLKSLGVDTSKFDEFTTEAFASVVKPLMARITQLEAGLKAVHESEGRRAANERFDKLDRLFAGNPAAFGEGGRADLDPRSVESRRRVAVIQLMQVQATADPRLSFEANFKAAAEMFAPAARPKAAPAAPAEAADDPHGFANGHTHRPTSRATAKAPKGYAAAVNNLTNRLTDLQAADPTDERDELPD